MKSPSKTKPTPSLNTFLEEKKMQFINELTFDGKIMFKSDYVWSFISASISEAWEINNSKKK